MRPFLVLLPLMLLLTACGNSRKRTGEKSLNSTRRHILSDAKAQLGRPYKWGGTTAAGGFDCSGLVYFAYNRQGIKLPRTTAGLATAGREIPLKRIQGADLLLFRGANVSGPVGHEGIVLHADGEATEFIHASSGQKGGGVIVSSLDQDYYKRRFLKAVNVIND